MVDRKEQIISFVEELRELAEAQFIILDKANNTVYRNAIQWHKNNCINPERNCEKNFLNAFLIALSERIEQEKELDIDQVLEKGNKEVKNDTHPGFYL